ncbi:MAG: outer membrane protein assembly factor BamD [Gemmatimonadetes bacterium]|nr:outer membrane protein assembly factor BamD [Gemmatimonadota bacterium]
MSKRTLRGVALLAMLTLACSGGPLLPKGSPEEQLARARYYLDDGDGTKALEAYRLLSQTLQGTEHEEESRLGMARAHRESGDYFAAVQEYEGFQRRFPRSPLVGDAVLEIAETYVEQRAKPEYDDDWNEKAIRQYEDFLAGYPRHPRLEEGRAGLLNARNHAALKELKNGITYIKLRRFRAARFYFDIVIDRWAGTDVVPEAHYESGRTFELQKNWEEAASHYRTLAEEYPDSPFAEKARERLARMEESS